MLLVVVLVLAHLLFIAGCYLTAAGVYLLTKGSVKAAAVLTTPLFWGLIAVLGGFCVICSPWLLPVLKQALS